MNFAQALSMISEALSKIWNWTMEFFPSDYWLAFMAAFVMYTASRLLLMPFIGHASSDFARTSVHSAQDSMYRRGDRSH